MENIRVDSKNNKVIVSLNPGFYPTRYVEEAIKDYKGVAEIKTNGHISLKPLDKKDLDLIGYEFCNYVLGLMKNS